ncbi:ATP-binding protein [Azohydromonas caseinilytica]|uniref:Oxygen sensor histidine kinase NreB n=1 Tax=Azohydromonas caseinilytica TaxID=2728836 RepID=A0A848FCD1_9BURK|nr:ATP-binding protein [Azohydromonas caseinilytica]NML17134.1 PAS domain-containing protein [Azohydromonas caseinilytica]
MDTDRSDSIDRGWPFAEGDMAQRVRGHDWAATPLGPLGQWPASLRTSVQTVLAHPWPTLLLWGPQLIPICNDAYRALMGLEPPAGLGQPLQACWPELWPRHAPICERVWQGESVVVQDILFPVTRPGRVEEAWFSLSYSPVRNEAGRVAGVWLTVVEATRRLRAEAALRESQARQAFLLRLSDALRPLADPVAVQAEAARVLGEHLGAVRVLYGEVSADGTELVVERNFVASGAAVLSGRFRMADFGPSLVAALQQGRSIAVADVAAAPALSAGEREAYAALGIAALVGVPLIKGGRFVANLNVHHAVPHAWTPAELALIEETAQRTWAAVEHARAEGALRRSEERWRALSAATADVIYRMGPDWTEMRALQGRGFLADLYAPTSDWLPQYIEPQDRDTVRQAIEQAIRHKAVFELEHRVRRADGSIGWTLSRAVPLLDAQGEIREWIGAARDITERKRAEAAQRDSEAQMRAIANLVPDLLWRSNAQGEVQWYSERWFEYTGQSPQAARGQGWADVLHPEDVPETLRQWREASLTGQPYVREHRLRRHDGEYRWFLTRAAPLRDRAGGMTLWYGSATDIHEQRGARELLEQRVAERAQALRELLLHVETLQDDERRRIARELHDSLGQFLSSLGLSCSGLRNTCTDPATREKLEQLHEQVLRLDRELDRIIFVLRPTALEDCGLGEGVAAYVRTWSELTGVTVDLELLGLDHDRLPTQVEAAVFRVVQEALTNVAKYAQASQVSVSLVRQRRQLVGSIEDDGVGFEAADATTPTASRTHWGLLGMQERVEALGGSFSVESSPGAGTTVLWRVPLRSRARGAEVAAGRDEAAAVPQAPLAGPSMAAGGGSRADAHSLAQTLLGRLAGAEAAVRARDDFLAIAGHELRSPMNALSLQLQAIERLLAQGHGARAAQELHRARRLLQRFVQRAVVLLDVSRLNADRLELDVEAVSVPALVDEVLDAYAEEAAARGSSLHAAVEPGLAAHWDRHGIEAVLCNLVTNAFKYGAGTPIRVTAARDGAERIRLTVSDGGPGIEEVHRCRIFERFERVVGVPGKSSGFGVGLWLVGRIARAHGGTVEVEVGPEGGTSLRVTLPAFATSTPSLQAPAP